jgi:CubicO group peptidase (beta-lactamase class C family)
MTLVVVLQRLGARVVRVFPVLPIAAAAAIVAGAVASSAVFADDESPAAAPAFDFSAAVEAANSMPRMHSLLVSWNGSLVLERYFHGKTRTDNANLKSASKSVISALVGIAIERGLIEGVDEPISDYFPSTRPGARLASKGVITIGNLLSMQSGLETTSNRNYGAWVLSSDWVEAALERPFVEPPGTRMIYSTGNTHLLSAILTEAAGKSTLEFAREALARPLGFELDAWPRGPKGIYFGGNDMEMTPRQMLAFGRLYLNGGRVGTRQVVPAAWIAASLAPRVESTREEGRYYGYGWWIRDFAGFTAPYAWGYGGQFVVLVPDLDLVVVATSASTPGTDRRAHTRRLYDLMEDLVIARAAAAVCSTGGAGNGACARGPGSGGPVARPDSAGAPTNSRQAPRAAGWQAGQ